MTNFSYISLFSSAGIGCYGFLQEGFDCIVTNELIPRRLDIQRCNNKCKSSSGYIEGDITQKDVYEKILTEISRWKSLSSYPEAIKRSSKIRRVPEPSSRTMMVSFSKSSMGMCLPHRG